MEMQGLAKKGGNYVKDNKTHSKALDPISTKQVKNIERTSLPSLLAALKTCRSSKDLQRGKKLHTDAIESGDDSNSYVTNSLLSMYAKCGSMVDAQLIFDKMEHPDVVTWNALILGYAENGKAELALQLFSRMQEEGCPINRVTCLAAVKANTFLAAEEKSDENLVKVECLEKGRAIQLKFTTEGHALDLRVASALIDMYAKCGSMSDARQIFDEIQGHDVVSWTALILGYAENGMGQPALDLFEQMQEEGFSANSQTFVAVIKACATLAADEVGKRIGGRLVKVECLRKGLFIHALAEKKKCDSNIYVASTLVDMYAKCGSMFHARVIFDKMQRHDVVSWTALMMGYVENGDAETAMEVMTSMKTEGCIPNARTFVAALMACTLLAVKESAEEVDGKFVKPKSLAEGRVIESEIVKTGHNLDTFVACTLIDLYSNCRSMVNARRIFDSMQQHNVVSWNILILGYAENDEAEFALELFSRMNKKGFAASSRTFVAALKACTNLAIKEEGMEVRGKLMKTSCLVKGKAIESLAIERGYSMEDYVSNSLVDMYAKCGSMMDARNIFDRMQCQELVSWTALILGYAENGESELALQLFECLQEIGCAPDTRTFVAALVACGNMTALEMGRTLHSQICDANFQNDPFVASCLIDFYGKCGNMVYAQQVFDSVTKKDIFIWNALLWGYSRQGDSVHVFALFEKMQEENLQVNGVTFLCILSLCSHLGLVEQGKSFFESMRLDHLVSPTIQHYTCMVDLYGRANQLETAVAMVKEMPFEPNTAIWRTVLSACEKWKNLGFGKVAFDALLKLDTTDATAFVLMTSLYSAVGELEKSEITTRGARKKIVDKALVD